MRLAVAGHPRHREPDRAHHLLLAQTQQLARGDRGADHPEDALRRHPDRAARRRGYQDVAGPELDFDTKDQRVKEFRPGHWLTLGQGEDRRGDRACWVCDRRQMRVVVSVCRLKWRCSGALRESRARCRCGRLSQRL
jgi:hypothetical protein